MNDKYYTPTIDEFHVGFEYEYYSEFDEESGDEDYTEIKTKGNWYNSKIIKHDLETISKPSTVKSCGGLCYLLNNNKIRVKYLDKTDIESLGFTEVNDVEVCSLFKTVTLHSDEETKYYIKYLDTHKLIKCYISIYQERSVRITKELFNKYNPRQVFQGTVKNKSELVKLLKMLGINE